MTLVDDTVVERDEQFQVDLVYSEGQPGVLLDTPAKASITVVNDDSECLGVGGRVGGGARWGVEGEGLGRSQVGSGGGGFGKGPGGEWRGRVWEGARWGVEGGGFGKGPGGEWRGRVWEGARWGVEGEGLGRGQVGSGGGGFGKGPGGEWRGRVWEGARWGVEGEGLGRGQVGSGGGLVVVSCHDALVWAWGSLPLLLSCQSSPATGLELCHTGLSCPVFLQPCGCPWSGRCSVSMSLLVKWSCVWWPRGWRPSATR